ncbi:MAG: Do family serine endopeptidase [Holosporales bacterium]
MTLSPALAVESAPPAQAATPSLSGDGAIVPHSRDQLQLSFSPVVKKVAPAVVNIYAARVVKPNTDSPFYNDPLFKHFFGPDFPFGNPEARIQSSLGSGVILRSDGLVVTNFHVIKNAEEIRVVLNDGREYDAEIVSRDKRTDLAALRILGLDKPLPYLELRDADELEVGDIVMAVGNPFGIGQTVTMGIVSGLARSEIGVKDFRSLIQTDAAINPGNSGGPLVTLDGRVVGINTSIISNTGSSVGIGFSIPSNLVAPVLASLEHGGKVVRPWAGISIKDAPAKPGTDLVGDAYEGVLVMKVYANSPADKGGLKAGDVIIKIDEHDTLNEAAYRFRLATSIVGKPRTFTVKRKGEVLKLQVAMETPPDIKDNKVVTLSGRTPLSGAVVTGLSPAVAVDLGLAYDEDGGVVVLRTRPGTPSAMSSLQPGDVILSVNGVKVTNVEELGKNLGRSARGWEFQVRRGGRVIRLVIKNG